MSPEKFRFSFAAFGQVEARKMLEGRAGSLDCLRENAKRHRSRAIALVRRKRFKVSFPILARRCCDKQLCKAISLSDSSKRRQYRTARRVERLWVDENRLANLPINKFNFVIQDPMTSVRSEWRISNWDFELRAGRGRIAVDKFTTPGRMARKIFVIIARR